MHDYIVDGLARSHRSDLMREVLREELRSEARHASGQAEPEHARWEHARHAVSSLLAHAHGRRMHRTRTAAHAGR